MKKSLNERLQNSRIPGELSERYGTEGASNDHNLPPMILVGIKQLGFLRRR